MEETVTSAMDLVLAQISNITTVTGNVFDIITANMYLAFFAAVSLVACGVHVFRIIKGAAR